MKLQNVTVNGNALTITRDEIERLIQAGIDTQLEYKESNDFTMWLMTAGYIEALKDMLAALRDRKEPESLIGRTNL